MPFPAQSTLGWQVCVSILQVLAITSTLVRLGHRWQRLYLWWDDWATILPLIFDILYFTIMWLGFHNKLVGNVFVSFWFDNILFLTIIWLSRTSLALSIARIFPPRHLCRRIAFSLTGIFIVLWIATVLMSALECYDGSVAEWWNVPLPLCVVKRPSAKGGIYLAIAFDFLADLFLISVPLVMLWGIKLPVDQRRLVLVLFSCSVLTLMSSVFFSTLGLVPLPALGPDAFLLLNMGAQLQAGISIIVCNLMVVATLLYRVSKRKPSPEDDSIPEKEPPPPTPPTLVVPPSADRRGTSIFRDNQPHIEGQNGTVMTGNPNLSEIRNHTNSVPTSGNPPSDSNSQHTSSNNPRPTQSTDVNSQDIKKSQHSNSNSNSQFTNPNSQYTNTNSEYTNSNSQYTSSYYTQIDPHEDPHLDTKTTAPAWSFPESQSASSQPSQS